MNTYLWAARTTIVLLGGVLIVTISQPAQHLFKALDVQYASDSLLYDKDSPFRKLGLLLQNDEQAPRTDIIIQTAKHPLGDLSGDDEQTVITIKNGTTPEALWSTLRGAAFRASDFVEAFAKRGEKKHPLRAGEVIHLKRRNGELIELRRALPDGSTMIIEGNTELGYRSRIEKVRLTSRERKVSGTIFTSLVDSARAIKLPYSVIDDFVDLFGERVEFSRDLQPGDTFTISFEERVMDDGSVFGTGEIRSASLRIRGEMLAVVRDVAKDGSIRYFDEKGQVPSKGFLRYPLKYTRISSVFSNARFHPVLKIKRPHNGVDFSAPTGTPVRSVGDGLVIYSGYSKTTGYMVRISHGSRYTSEYMHLSKIATQARRGARIARGSVLGAVGSTGLASGPHLHYGLFDKGKYIDPMRAKIAHDIGVIKPSANVIARLSEMKKEHDSVAVAAVGRKSKA